MANTLSPEKIAKIRKLYAECGVKAKVAKMIGCSPATVAKYVNGTQAKKLAEQKPANETPKMTGSGSFRVIVQALTTSVGIPSTEKRWICLVNEGGYTWEDKLGGFQTKEDALKNARMLGNEFTYAHEIIVRELTVKEMDAYKATGKWS